MQELKRLTVGRPDSDFENHPVIGRGDQVSGHVVEFGKAPDRRFVDDPAHLEAANVPRHDASFDERRGPTRCDQRDQFEVLRGNLGDRWCRLHDDGKECACFGVPDANREVETRSTAGELPAVPLGHDVERGRVPANRPDQAGSECAAGRTVDDHPGGTVDDQPGAGAELDRLEVDDLAEVLGHEARAA